MRRNRTPSNRVVRALHQRVAFVFDFDHTLAERTTDVLLRLLDVDPEEFRTRVVEPRVAAGWSERLAEAHGLVELSRSDRGPITRTTLAAAADAVELYPGAATIFERVSEAVRTVDADLDVEFHVLTAGFVEVPSATEIAHHFESIVGCEWGFDEDGAIAWPKRLVGHYDKVRHLLALAKGLDSVAADRPDDIDRQIPEHEWHVPLEQMIYIGDGDSDLPAFDFMESHSGVAIAVHSADSPTEWEARPNMRSGRQVATVVEADYREGSPLADAILAAGRRAALWTRVLETHTARS